MLSYYANYNNTEFLATVEFVNTLFLIDYFPKLI